MEERATISDTHPMQKIMGAHGQFEDEEATAKILTTFVEKPHRD